MMNNSIQSISLSDYKIILGDASSALTDFLSTNTYSQIFVLVDENTYEHCWSKISPVISNYKHQLIRISSGELHKNINTSLNIWSELMNKKADRKSLLINLGGGVIGDMGGFCASTFKRGIDFVQIPTTLLSQVDASIGGKLGIDFQDVKNSIGLFSNPETVLIDTEFLQTLPEREVRSGFAELLKHGLIADKKAWQDLTKIDEIRGVDWNAFIYDSLLVKKRVVESDPFERGLRKSLNFGHTIGHAIESHALKGASPFLHGEAVAIGMVAEAFLSHKVLGLPGEELDEISTFIKKIYGFHLIKKSDFDTLVNWMKQDKKNEGEGINFSLLPAIGNVEVNHICSVDLIKASFEYYNKTP